MTIPRTLIATALLVATTTVASLAIAAGAPAAGKPVANAPQKSDRVAAAQSLLDDLQHAHYDAVVARFDATMKAQLGATQLKAVWESLPNGMGALQRRGPPTVATQASATTVSIPLVFAKGTLVAQVTSIPAGQVSGFFIRPEAAPPPPPARTDLPSREISFGPAGRTLPGTLLLPKPSAAKMRYTAVVLVHGSGPNDRDETVGGMRVFRDLAEGLAERGIASLRYEKRSKARPQDFGPAFTIDQETTDDAVAAVAFLKTQPDIDPTRIFVVGHSQGAMMAPRIAQKSPGLAGIVMMAAPARPLEDLVIDQMTYATLDDGKIDATEQAQLDAAKIQIAAVKKINRSTPPTQKFFLGLPASYWLSMQGYDGVAVARALTQPMLILQGDRDFQVTAPDWKRWHAAFAIDKRATIRHYPAMNHLFVAGQGRGTDAEYNKPAHVDAQVIADIAAWIKAR